MENINGIIKGIENGTIGTLDETAEFTHLDNTHCIELQVDGHPDITVLFAEIESIQELRAAVEEEGYTEEPTASSVKLDEAMEMGLDDIYNYDKVVAYRVDGDITEL